MKLVAIERETEINWTHRGVNVTEIRFIPLGDPPFPPSPSPFLPVQKCDNDGVRAESKIKFIQRRSRAVVRS